MFPDRSIAKSFQCNRTIASYIAHIALAPYVHELLLKKVSSFSYYIVQYLMNLLTPPHKKVKWI